jgi:2-polyprenyl-3-methyl-5-hydroxy-6-metoxy-1,4-benzoquinol methylase
MFRWLRWQIAKKKLASWPPMWPPDDMKLFWESHGKSVADLVPDTDAYARLASVWDDFAGWFVPAYEDILESAEDYYGQPMRVVLDLACGTGLLTRRIARRARMVIGLDASEAMLERAQSRTPQENVRYIQGDFREFSLNETFDGVVCSSDSLNYIQTPEELAKVFFCVHNHLRSGGLFLFDVLDDTTFRTVSGLKTGANVAGEWFLLYHFYDAKARVAVNRAVFKDAIERHRQIPSE